ncbi:MAG: VOC family protein [Kiritimatiellia bacterium]
MMFKRIDHVEIVPKNAEKTIDFYVNVLGFSIRNRIPMKISPIKEIVYLALGDTVIEIIAVDNPAPKPNHPWEVGYRGIALEVNNMVEAVGYLQGKGVVIASEPIDLGDSVRGEIRDPDGLIIELRQWK